MISVCITTYNGEKHLNAQLDSILIQLNFDDEIIISDDGSTDSTLEIIKSYNDKRIKVFNHTKDNTFSNYTFNKITKNIENALMYAKGDFVFLADQDDVWKEDKVERCLKGIKNNLLLFHDCEVIDYNQEVIIQSYFVHNHSHNGLFYNLINSSYLGCCMVFRKELLNKALPFPKEPIPHDLWLGFIAESEKSVVKYNEKLIYYRRHSGNQSTSAGKSEWSIAYRIKYRLLIAFAFIKRITNLD